jgi:hypothetical protein
MPSDHPSRPSFEVVRDQMKVDIKEAPKNHSGAKSRVCTWRAPLFLIHPSFSLLASHRLSYEIIRDVSQRATFTLATIPLINLPPG